MYLYRIVSTQHMVSFHFFFQHFHNNILMYDAHLMHNTQKQLQLHRTSSGVDNERMGTDGDTLALSCRVRCHCLWRAGFCFTMNWFRSEWNVVVGGRWWYNNKLFDRACAIEWGCIRLDLCVGDMQLLWGEFKYTWCDEKCRLHFLNWLIELALVRASSGLYTCLTRLEKDNRVILLHYILSYYQLILLFLCQPNLNSNHCTE